MEGAPTVVRVGGEGIETRGIGSSVRSRVIPGTFLSVSAAVLDDGRAVAAAVRLDRGESPLQLWDLRSGTGIGTGIAGPMDNDGMVTARVDGRVAAVVARIGSRTAAVVDMATGQLIAEPAFAPGDAVAEVDGAAVVVRWDGGLVVDDLMAAGRPIRTIPALEINGVLAVAVVDGVPVAAVDGSDNAVLLYDLGTGRRLGGPLRGHGAPVVGLDVADLRGRPVLVSLAQDGVIRVWDLAVRAAGPA